LIKHGKVLPEKAPEALAEMMRRLEEGIFTSPAYIGESGKPMFLVFGPQYYQKDEFTRAFNTMKSPPAYYSLMDKRPG
ncbi:hypothetical protein ABTD04_20905, partial [Acinetobacter baumannii]